MGELRTVRKYSNRRLYDLAEGRYVSLAELYTPVAAGAELRVSDADTKEDITSSVLFKMLAGLEKRADPSLSLGFLLQAVRSRTESPAWMIATFLEQSLNLFTAAQTDQKELGSEVDANPQQKALRLAAANYRRWCSVQGQIHQMVANAESGAQAAVGQQTSAIAPLGARRLEGRSKRSPRQVGVRAQR